MSIEFEKMHGLGNDFVLIDARRSLPQLSVAQMQHIANRRTGIGCDQILIISSPSVGDADGKYEIYNGDGSVAEHCGNGVRCVAEYLLAEEHYQRDRVRIEISGKVFDLIRQDDGEIRADMGSPILDPGAVPSTYSAQNTHYDLEVSGQHYQIGVVSMGNPHAVFEVPDVSSCRIDELGLALQNHARFPKKVNAGFMQIINTAEIKLRVYERGVGETLACGTGACAAMVVGRLRGDLDSKVRVHVRGGMLTIQWSGLDSDPVWMTGPATHVFKGSLTI